LEEPEEKRKENKKMRTTKVKASPSLTKLVAPNPSIFCRQLSVATFSRLFQQKQP
jgi:hypothetical protein